LSGRAGSRNGLIVPGSRSRPGRAGLIVLDRAATVWRAGAEHELDRVAGLPLVARCWLKGESGAVLWLCNRAMQSKRKLCAMDAQFKRK
jgi:hypothetical protein